MNKVLLPFVLLFFFIYPATAVYGQQDEKNYFLVDSLNYEELHPDDSALLDSLLFLFHKAKHDTIRLHILNNIVEQCIDPEVWPKYNLYMLELAKECLQNQTSLRKEEENALKMKVAEALGNIGFLHLNKGKSEQALVYFQKSLAIQRGMPSSTGMAAALVNIGYIYKYKGDIAKALDYYDRGLKVFEKINNRAGIANTLNNIGLIYKNQGEIDKALEYYNQSLSIWKELGNSKQIAATLINIGYIYYGKGDEEKALEHYFKALELDKANGDQLGIASSLNSIGLVYFNRNDLTQAKENFVASLKINLKTGNSKGISESYYNLGLIYLEEKQIENAFDYGIKSLEISRETSYPRNIGNAAELLSKIYIEKGNWKQAFKMRELEIQMRDSLFNQETQRAAITQQMNYDHDKQEMLKEAEFHKKLAIEREEKKRQKLFNFATAGGLFIMVIFAGFIYSRYRYSRKQNNIIEQQKQLVDVAFGQLSEKNKDITDSINYAKRIQDAILKEQDQVSEHLPQHFILYKPKDIVSGDFYWSLEKQFPDKTGINNYWYFAAGDCTGHGVPGAFMSMLGVAFLNEITGSERFLSPATILDLLRSRIIKELNQSGKEGESHDGMDISIACLNLSTFEMQWSGSNNPLYIISHSDYSSDSILKSANGQIKLHELKPNKQPISYHPSPVPFTDHCIQLKKDTSIYLLTDGFADQFGGPKSKKFKSAQLKKVLLENNSYSMLEQKEILGNTFESWKGELEQIDDVCIIGMRI